MHNELRWYARAVNIACLKFLLHAMTYEYSINHIWLRFIPIV